MQSPTEIRAYNGKTYFSLNNNGISFRDSHGVHALFGVDDHTGRVTGNFFVDEANIGVLDASHIKTDTIHSLGEISGPIRAGNVTINTDGSSNISVGTSTAIDDGMITTSTISAANITASSELTVGQISIFGRTIQRDDSHVMWSESQHTNLGAYINAHIKSSAIIGGKV